MSLNLKRRSHRSHQRADSSASASNARNECARGDEQQRTERERLEWPYCCCVPMAMPQGHLVALCTDLGIAPSHGAAMLSVLLGTAFFSRQAWGWISDRIGGLMTVLIGSVWQFLAVVALTLTQDEIGLFTVSALFGLGFSGIIPAYALIARELFPAREAGWRIPLLLFCSGAGMASGGWFAGCCTITSATMRRPSRRDHLQCREPAADRHAGLAAREPGRTAARDG